MSSELPLHPLEKKLIVALSENSGVGESVDFDRALELSGLSPDQLRRAIEWLKSKNLLLFKEEAVNVYSLGNEGMRVAREGFPERRLVNLLVAKGGSGTFSEIFMAFGNDSSIALGKAKENGWVSAEGRKLSLSSQEIPKDAEELLVEKLSSLGNVSESSLDAQEKETLALLLKRYRGLVSSKPERKLHLELTQAGREATTATAVEEIDSLTPQVLASGAWKSRPLRAIDVSSPAPNIFAGRPHPVRVFMQEVREAFISLGFEEISGPIAQSAFWNFDSLFIAQQHPTREMQDTFYVSGIKADLGKFKPEMASVKGSHERGDGTGSLGWRYAWSEEEASRVVLRTHTTALTIRYLSEKKPEEARVFSIGKVFRNEKPNYKNNPEFYQIEGVTVGPKLNVRNLISLITKFYAKLGFASIKFWPTYFPYTEPSFQTMVFMDKMQKWLELGGMGVFRPEVTVPLGVKNPVLAWGLGLDRLVMLRYGLKDLRDLFGANLGWLRSQGVE
ncbi:MAG TPA: phenylalanine--tRNA ligase subunit alpha [Nitrososphaerales archaeon]|nr:phenylalanine--tRNA ligase subunit alpha [Nitrososphaerales archaeon]